MRRVVLLLLWFCVSCSLRADDGEMPQSKGDFGVTVDPLERRNRSFDARDDAAAAALSSPGDSEVLRRLSRINDVFGDDAGETFEKYATSLERSSADPASQRETLERGVTVALRDGDLDSARKMAERLRRLGETNLSRIALERKDATSSSFVRIPGGMAGLAQALGLRPDLPPKRFLAEYAQAILQSNGPDKVRQDALKKTVRLYLDTARGLMGLGRPGSNGVEIRLETQTPAGYAHTEQVLELLGWRIRRVRNSVELEVRDGEKSSIRQSFAAGFSIDEAEMKIRLEGGSDFTFTIREDRVPLLFDESFWLALAPARQAEREMLEELLNSFPTARLYFGLASMSEQTQQAVVKGVDRQLLLKRAASLALYGSSIVVRGGAIDLPGGPAASAGWAQLAGVSPEKIPEFLTSVLNKDGGKLLSYYYAMAVVPSVNQAFFTKTPDRLAAFYKAFPFNDADGIDNGVFFRKDDYFAQLTRELPLNPDGSAHFPGGPRIWALAKDPAGSIEDIEKLAGQLHAAQATDADDAILLRMLDRDYSVGTKQFNQIQSYLAAVRIEHLRREPIDETMALALSETYSKYGSLYPYVAALPTLSGKDLLLFFRAAERIESFGDRLNAALGEFHAVTKLVLLLGQSGSLSDKQSVEILVPLWQKIAGIRDAGEMTAIVFDSVKGMMAAAGKSPTERADDFLLRALAGENRPRDFSINGVNYQVNRATVRTSRIKSVLKLQMIGSLQDLLDIYDAAGTAARSPSAGTGRMDSIVMALPEPRGAASAKVPKVIQAQLQSERTAIVSKAAMALKKETAKRTPKQAPRLAAELIQKLDAFLEPVLAGWVYAFYLSPDDLVPSSDPFFVRKHVFFDASRKVLWPPTYVMNDADSGSYIEGGFAQFGAVAGMIGISRLKPSESALEGPGRPVIAANIAAIRSAPWQRMDDATLHFVALNLRLGREFVIQSAFHPEFRDELAAATIGMIGLRRRSELLDSLGDLDFKNAFSLLSSSDVFFLADAYRRMNGARLTGNVNEAIELERAGISVERLHDFGGSYPTIYGSTQNRFLSLGPYEEYDHLLLSEPLSERMSHFLLDLAEAADRAELPVDALSLIAETAARQLSSRLHMSSKDDWMPAIDAMHGVDINALIPALGDIR